MTPIRTLLITLLFTAGMLPAYAKHVKGGFIQYTYNGAGASSGSSNYTITVTVFFRCTTVGPCDNVYLGIFSCRRPFTLFLADRPLKKNLRNLKITYNFE